MKKQIVIELTEEDFHRICQEYVSFTDTLEGRALSAISNGTVLEPHGRLADLDAALKCVDDDSLEPCDAKWQAIRLFDWAMSKRVVLEASKEDEE